MQIRCRQYIHENKRISTKSNSSFSDKKIHVLFWISHIHQKSITRQRSREQCLLYRISSEFFGTNIPGKDRLKDWGNRQRLTPAYLFCKAAIMLSFVDLSALQEYFSVQIPFVRLKIMLQSKKKPQKPNNNPFSLTHQKNSADGYILPDPLSYMLELGGTLGSAIETSHDTWPYVMSVQGWWLITPESGSISLKRQANKFISFNNIGRYSRLVKQSCAISGTWPEFEWLSLEESSWDQTIYLSEIKYTTI